MLNDGTYRKSQMPGYQEDGEAEGESIVQIVVIDDNRRAEDDPYGNDDRSAELGLASGFRGRSRDRGRKDA